MALVVTRNVGEDIILGDPSAPLGAIRISNVHGNKVSLAIDLPRSLIVHRREIAERILGRPLAPFGQMAPAGPLPVPALLPSLSDN